MARISRVEIAVEKAQERMAVELSRLRVKCDARQKDSFRDLQ
jgi:hypothetical protein